MASLKVGNDVFCLKAFLDLKLKMFGGTDHEPPVENPCLLDPEEGLDGPGEAVLVPQLGHQRARHLVMLVMVMIMVMMMVLLDNLCRLRSSTDGNSGSLSTKTVLGEAGVVPEI